MYLALRLTGAPPEPLMQGLMTMIVGMSVVFLALALIMVMLKLMHLLPSGVKPVASPARPEPAAPKAAPAAATAGTQDFTGIAPEIVAVISAAVVAVGGAHARVRSIRLVRPAGQSPWVEQGRSRHHQSHRVQRGKR